MEKSLLKVVLVASVMLTTASCEPPSPKEAKVWSSSSSNDGYAPCPNGTTVVGGGHEMAEQVQAPGKLPHVVASVPHGNGWRVVCTDDKGSPTAGCKAWVVCASILR